MADAWVAEDEAYLPALSRAAGLRLDAYRLDYVQDRIRLTVERENLSGPPALVRLLGRDADARGRFRRAVAVSVSGLFRDPAQFRLLEQRLLPPLVARPGRIGVWSAGCADGSELYSVAMLLERRAALDRALLLGSDVLDENLAAARRGVDESVGIPPGIRAVARWERRDLVTDDPPPGRWRLVLCRNVAIYLAPWARRTLHEKLAAALAPGGILLLGRAERLGDPGTLGLEYAAPHAYRSVA